MTAPIIVMGAHGGIGEALAKQLIEQGEEVVATARDEGDLSDLGASQTHSLDITDAGAISELIEQADQGDGIKGLAYCIGTIDLKPFKNTKDDAFLNNYEINVLGAVRALQAAEASLKKAGGSVVLFSTIAVQMGFPNHTLISTAKGAVEGLTRSLAAEWAPKVRVNAIAPSLSDTPLAKPMTSSEQMAKSIANMHPIPRLGAPEDSAAMAAFLLSDAAGWITGQILHVDGGRSAVGGKG